MGKVRIDAEKLRMRLKWLPGWLPTIVCFVLILYLTLMPEPLGDRDLMLFPGFDKVVHGIMFFGLTLCMLFDAMRSRDWKALSLPLISLIVFIGGAAGIIIEYLQKVMELGRGLELWDMMADVIGAVIAGTIWIFLQQGIAHADEELQKHKHDDLCGSSDL